MAASTGAYYEAKQYAAGQALPITFVVEDNDLSVDSPTVECWGLNLEPADEMTYYYKRGCPHSGTGVYVVF
jgi:hypothetical protein